MEASTKARPLSMACDLFWFWSIWGEGQPKGQRQGNHGSFIGGNDYSLIISNRGSPMLLPIPRCFPANTDTQHQGEGPHDSHSPQLHSNPLEKPTGNSNPPFFQDANFWVPDLSVFPQPGSDTQQDIPREIITTRCLIEIIILSTMIITSKWLILILITIQ